MKNVRHTTLFAVLLMTAAVHGAQVAEIAVFHEQGQSFITWREVSPPVTNPQIGPLKFYQTLLKLEQEAEPATDGAAGGGLSDRQSR